jgi:hypothetical protein
LVSLWAARENRAAIRRANKQGARDGLGEKAEGGGASAAEKTSEMTGCKLIGRI